MHNLFQNAIADIANGGFGTSVVCSEQAALRAIFATCEKYKHSYATYMRMAMQHLEAKADELAVKQATFNVANGQISQNTLHTAAGGNHNHATPAGGGALAALLAQADKA